MAEEDNIEEQEDQTAEGGEEGEEGGEPPKKSNKLLLIIAAVVLILGAGAGAFFLLPEPEPEVPVGAEEPAVPAVYFFDLPEIVVNLDSPGRTQAFLKIKISLEVAYEEDLTALEARLPRLQDDFQIYLRSLRKEDLQGQKGLFNLKQNLLLRASQSAEPVRIQRLLLREVLVQ